MSLASEIRVARCSDCHRVYDARSYAVGATFVCACSAQITVASPAPRTSPVIRCSSCGGSRDPKATSCAFCGAVFTVRERDLSAMCAACGARAGSNDAYCSACGEAVVHIDQAARPGKKVCPVCDDHRILQHRALTDAQLLECQRCGGVWLDTQAFAKLAAQARAYAREHGATLVNITPTTVRPQSGPAYRKCIECDTIMQRKNYGRKSGVVVDICVKHGIWFDAHEMDEILRWLRNGGQEAPDPRPQATIDKNALRALNVANTAQATAAPRTSVLGMVGDVFDVVEFVGDILSLFRH